MYLATSNEIQGLVAQGRTIQETIEIARDLARKLLEAAVDTGSVRLAPAREAFDYPLIVATWWARLPDFATAMSSRG